MDIELPAIFNVLVVLFCITAFVLVVLQLIFLVRFKLLQRRYSRAILATNAGIWEWFPETERLYVSAEFFMRLGFVEEKVPTTMTEWEAFLSPQDLAHFKTWKAELLEQEAQFSPKLIRLRIENAQHTAYWIEMRGSATRWNKRHQVHNVAGVFEEISHLVSTENALITAREESRQRELTLSSLLNNIPDAVWSKDEQGRYLDCNQAFLDFNLLSPDDIKGKTDKDLNLDGKGDYYQRQDDKALKSGITVHEQSWGYPKDGGEPRLFDVHRVPINAEASHFNGMLGVARDITERHLLINQLKLFKSFADNSAQGFAMATLEGEICYFNSKIRTLLGVNNDADESFLAPLNYLDFYPEVCQKFLHDTVFPYVKEHGVWQGELQAKKIDGSIFPTHETYFLLRDENGQATSVGDIMSDITEQKRASIQLEQAKEAAEQANQAKSHFLANMSHEIRTPLNAIIGYAQLISEDNQLEGVSRSRFLSIASAGERLLALINDILDIARIESGRLVLHEQKINLCKEIHQIGKLFQGQAQNKGLTLVVDCDLEEGALIWMDPVKFQQILTNLLGNAVKFTAQGYVKVAARIEGERIHILIEDTGPGIEDELMAHLFTPFVQGKAGEASGGTGLGLALSTTLIKLMQGSLSVKSSEGAGTQILIDLPLSTVQESGVVLPEEQAAFINMRLSEPICVLVAEDDAWSRDILVSLLEKAGCQIIEAEDGEQAIKAFRANPPDLVMTDIRMPHKSGIDLLKVIQQEDPTGQIPVIAVTASTLMHEQQALLDDGFWQVIAKPYQIDTIYKALTAHLDVQFSPYLDSKAAVYDANSMSSTENMPNDEAEILCPLTPAEWAPLLDAAQGGDVQATQAAFSTLHAKLSHAQRKDLHYAIDQFDLGSVETLIAQYQMNDEEG
ncbi:response regulator [Marinomonas sp. M1K-6]|uniref:histidine kinase n=1 Tax=Marinomonas profundi TaxID=2726122 RepID=A0A847R3Q3_9GAMM|nr:ATP-binding protein [Marinomonas profundi]NLQ16596.1 response regulator [Marinomonas profundi]UDV03820.1 response regulator [Marinomonas profundi]